MFRLLLGVFLVSGLAIAADPQKGEPKRKPKVKPDYAHPFAVSLKSSKLSIITYIKIDVLHFFQASYRVNDDELFATIREQSTQVAEATLAEQVKFKWGEPPVWQVRPVLFSLTFLVVK